MKRLITLTALFALAVPAAFAAPPPGKGNPNAQGSEGALPNPARLCKEQAQTMGAANFQSTYAPNGKPASAMGKCVSLQTQLASSNAENAAKKCKAERLSKGVQVFKDEYGTNASKANAIGKCVSKYAKQQTEAQQEATLNAAKKCKAERLSKGVSAFNTEYGTSPSKKKNAFGKCVTKYAKVSS